MSVADAAALVGLAPAAARAAVRGVSPTVVRERPSGGGWTVVEYSCHLRDALVVYTLRLHRARTEERPTVDPMLNDVRAVRFRHNDSDLNEVLADIERAAFGVQDEVALYTATQWDRRVVRMPGEDRTARWLIRQAMHEAIHHVRDIEQVARAIRDAAGASRRGYADEV